MLTEEGYLVVRDEYLPGPDVDGFQAAPNWMLNDEGDSEDAERHWYDARDESRLRQTQRKRVLLYMHPDRRLEFGQVPTGHRRIWVMRCCAAHSAGPFCAKAKSRFGWQCCGRSKRACIPGWWRH